MDIETFIARALQILLALGGAYLLATWFVLAIWTFRDIESRSRSVVTQVFSTLLVVLFWVPGWLLYRMLRPSDTLDQAYQRSLEEEYLLQDLQEMPLCPSCNHFVDDEWRLCPHCNTQLREDCDNCGRLVDLRWSICPYCGVQHEQEDAEVTVDTDRWVDPAEIERRLRQEERRRLREQTRALPAQTAATTLGQEVLEPRVAPIEHAWPEPPAAEPAARNGSDAETPAARQAEPDLTILGETDDESSEDEEADPSAIPDRFRIR